MSTLESSVAPTFQASLSIPAHATAVTFNDSEDVLAVGSDDGSVRLYKFPDTKVVKAIRGLEDCVSGIVLGSAESNVTFVAAGHSIYQFSLNTEKLILGHGDATSCIVVREKPADDDTLNNIAIDAERTRIAFTLDSGGVGVLDAAAGTIKRMRPKHTAIAYVVAFIPGHPNELVSGGYDCAIHHYNVNEGTLMTKFEFPSTTPFAPGISRSPPFVTSLALSSTGTLAAGCADGRVWISRSEEEFLASAGSSRKKKSKGKKGEPSKRWRGLDAVKGEECGRLVKVADGLVPALCFNSCDELVVSSLSGEITSLDLRSSGQPPATDLIEDRQNSTSLPEERPIAQCWNIKLQTCGKVNAIALAPSVGRVIIGGLDSSLKKGTVEVWNVKKRQTEESSE